MATVAERILELTPGIRVVVLAGRDYREFLVPALNVLGATVEVPMEGLAQGRQSHWLKVRTERDWSIP
jgi:hypothetical protein